MAENENETQQEKKNSDSPLIWLLILIINVALIFFMWNYYQKLKSEVVKETIGTATITHTSTTTVQEKAIVAYDLGEILYNDLKTAHQQMNDNDFATAQETLTHAVNVVGLILKVSAVESNTEVDIKIRQFHDYISNIGYHLSHTLELLYKEQNDEAMAYFTQNIDLEKLKALITEGKQYYINLLLSNIQGGE